MSVVTVVSLGLGLCCAAAADEVKVRVGGVTSIARTDDNFVCATLDWWPQDKCDYNQCPWGNAGILNLVCMPFFFKPTKLPSFTYLLSQDLNNTILKNAIKAFDSLRIRVGGSLQDQVVYKVGRHAQNCHDFKHDDAGVFLFSGGCLPMDRWDQLNNFFNQTGYVYIHVYFSCKQKIWL